MKHNPNPPENHHLDKYKHVITISNLAPVYPLPSFRSRPSIYPILHSLCTQSY